jgi:hypothetical protein
MGILTKDQYKRLAKPTKRHKYSAQKTRDMDGVECPSILHAQVANMLIQSRDTGAIASFDREVAVRLSEKCNACGAGAIVYKVDFKVTGIDGTEWYVEPKGAEVASFRKRKRLWSVSGPTRLEIWKGRYRNGMCIPYLAETVYPKWLK